MAAFRWGTASLEHTSAQLSFKVYFQSLVFLVLDPQKVESTDVSQISPNSKHKPPPQTLASSQFASHIYGYGIRKPALMCL